jgi:hypothetical protein
MQILLVWEKRRGTGNWQIKISKQQNPPDLIMSSRGDDLDINKFKLFKTIFITLISVL